jgi:signal transduction histidine kinase
MAQLGRRDAIFLGIVVALVALFGFSRPVLRLLTPSDGTLIHNSALSPHAPLPIYIAKRASTSLRAGDRVLAIDNRSPDTLAAAAKSFSSPSPPAGALRYRVLRDGQVADITVIPRAYLRRRLVEDWPNSASALIYFGLGAFVFVRRPRLHAARALLLLGASVCCVNLFRAFDLEPTDLLHGYLFGLSTLALTLVGPHVYTAMLHFSLVFPTPFPIVLRLRWLIPGLYTAVGAGFALINYLVLPAIEPSAIGAYALSWRLSYIAGFGVIVGALALSIVNGRRARTALEKQQWTIVFVGALISVGGTTFSVRVPRWLGVAWDPPSAWIALFEAFFPIALAIAVLRYRLFAIGTLVNRALLYGVLTVGAIGIYAAVVIGIGTLFEGQGNIWLSMIATGIIAVLFQPLRVRLQRWIDRRMYGDRGDPYLALTHLGQRLGAAQEALSGLRAAAETVARALNTPYAAITLDGRATIAESGTYRDDLGALVRWPLRYQGEPIGEVRAAPRLPGEALSDADERLIADLLPQLTLAAHTARLTEDLQHSRQRTIAALEDERRRLRRDLHDGLGPTLAAVMLNIDTARDRLSKQTRLETVGPLLDETRALSGSALSEVRRVAYDLRPPALDDLGLTGALRQHADRLSVESGLIIDIHSEVDAIALPAAVEVAAFRIATEALTNSVRHASARHGAVALRVSHNDAGDALDVSICDDGIGLPSDLKAGVGLHSMRERVDELGGALAFEPIQPHGLRVHARLPLGQP